MRGLAATSFSLRVLVPQIVSSFCVVSPSFSTYVFLPVSDFLLAISQPSPVHPFAYLGPFVRSLLLASPESSKRCLTPFSPRPAVGSSFFLYRSRFFAHQ